jgi:hypothetical protein
MSKIEVNTIDKQSGSTLTLGGSGTAVTLGSGATQSGFGRAGSVNWQTTIKTGDFTAVNGEGYFINTTSGAITMTLPSSPSVGDIVSFKDYARTFDSNILTVGRAGSNMDGTAADSTFNTEGLSATLIYMDATKGWSLINEDATSQIGPQFIAASGGTETNSPCGNFKIHTFTGPGTFTVSNAGNSIGSNTVSYLVLAGAGGGGGGNGGGGGGGAGGYRESRAASDSYTASPLNATSGPTYNLPVSAQGYPIVVGGGGAGHPGSPPCADGGNGNTSSFSTISSAGGGGGSGVLPATADAGGSGGGAGGPGPATVQQGGLGNQPPVSPAQGNNGGTAGSPSGSNNQGGGGGGAGSVGENALPEGAAPSGIPNSFGGNGGLGVTSCITGSPVGRAGGGGGNQERPAGLGAGKGGNGPQPAPNRNTTPGAGGLGNFGAGNGSFGACVPGNNTNGTANVGGGGGGVDTPQSGNAGNGGSGIVIIRYKFQ